jgi:hypothetical protein
MDVRAIYSQINQQTLMDKYFPDTVVLGKMYCNPFRFDKKPTCFFNWTKRGNFCFYDYAHPEYAGGVIDIIRLRYNISCKEAIDMICKDYNIQDNGIRTKEVVPIKETKLVQSEYKKKYTAFNITKRNWSITDTRYWTDRFDISIDLLKEYDIFPVKSYSKKSYIDKDFIHQYDYSTDDPCYCYKFDYDNEILVKLYRPLAKDKQVKWRTNTNDSIIQGYKQLPASGKTLYICSSMKDALVMINCGYIAIAPQAEGIKINKSVIEDLKRRFNNIYIIYDNDSAGIKFMKSHSIEYDLPYIILEDDKAKDLAELYELLKCKNEYKLRLDNWTNTRACKESNS